MKYDILIIGAGIVGSSIAFELSKYDLKVAVVEKENDVSLGTTKANSGIVHAGYDPRPGTIMARLNVLGNKMYEELAPKLNVHYKKIGSLVIGRNDKDKALIEELYRRGIENGVPELSIIDKDEIKKIEPNLNEDITVALLAKSAAVVSPWEMCLALMENAVRNGVELHLNSEVKDIKKENDCFIIKTDKNTFESQYVINAAGLYSDKINSLVTGRDDFSIVPIKGEYYLLDKGQGKTVNHVIFQTPNELGKGVLVSRTVHGNLIVGPNASFDLKSKDDVSVTQEALDYIRKASALSCSNINFRDNIRNFSGVRATISKFDDFIIGESDSVKGFINFAGIKSPGLTCGPAFGIEAKEILERSGLVFTKKDDFILVPLPKFFNEMSKEEIDMKIKENPLYGRIICRCETVSEGQIVDALHRPIVVPSIDAIKRRTNAGMGRCQGGFCGPKVLEIIKRELNLEPTEIMQDKEGSNIVLNYTKGGVKDE